MMLAERGTRGTRLHEEAEAALQQRAVFAGEDDLVVALAPPGALLEAVSDLLGRLTHGQVLRHVAALRKNEAVCCTAKRCNRQNNHRDNQLAAVALKCCHEALLLAPRRQWAARRMQVDGLSHGGNSCAAKTMSCSAPATGAS